MTTDKDSFFHSFCKKRDDVIETWFHAFSLSFDKFQFIRCVGRWLSFLMTFCCGDEGNGDDSSTN